MDRNFVREIAFSRCAKSVRWGFKKETPRNNPIGKQSYPRRHSRPPGASLV